MFVHCRVEAGELLGTTSLSSIFKMLGKFLTGYLSEKTQVYCGRSRARIYLVNASILSKRRIDFPGLRQDSFRYPEFASLKVFGHMVPVYAYMRTKFAWPRLKDTF